MAFMIFNMLNKYIANILQKSRSFNLNEKLTNGLCRTT